MVLLRANIVEADHPLSLTVLTTGIAYGIQTLRGMQTAICTVLHCVSSCTVRE
jgi:hypothetical protein